MMRPQIRPGIFIGFQNAVAAALFTALLAAEFNRRLLHAYPDSGVLWWLSTLANRTVTPLLRQIDRLLVTPDKLLSGLVAGIAISLLSWWTRYWLTTALAGHLSLAASVVITLFIFQRGRMGQPWSDPMVMLSNMQTPVLGLSFLALSLFVLIMCIADHVAFIRFFVALLRRIRFAK